VRPCTNPTLYFSLRSLIPWHLTSILYYICPSNSLEYTFLFFLEQIFCTLTIRGINIMNETPVLISRVFNVGRFPCRKISLRNGKSFNAVFCEFRRNIRKNVQKIIKADWYSRTRPDSCLATRLERPSILWWCVCYLNVLKTNCHSVNDSIFSSLNTNLGTFVCGCFK
jgi:hypothetical protein